MIKKKIKAGITNLRSFVPPEKGPDELLGELFQDVQLRRIHPDGKTFVDLVSERGLRRIAKAYAEARQDPHFDLSAFVQQHFKQYIASDVSYHASEKREATEHINTLWPMLTRSNYRTRGSLLPLPYPYVVPGGRFLEQFYWDTYFIMLGLSASRRIDAIEEMMKNYAYLIRKVGFIPTANRSYFMSRSQPPFFAHMVRLLAAKRGKRVMVQFLPYLLAEYRFWMKGRRNLTPERQAVRRVVRMPDGSVLNRYYDNKQTPRPESYREDVETAVRAPERIPSRVYLDLRAGAESGWDFSSRWFTDPADISTIHTTDIVPVDLNCLLHDLEQVIAETYGLLKQPLLAKRFTQRASARAAAIRRYCWNETEQFFFDYDFKTATTTPSWHLGAAFPLFSQIATDEEAAHVVRHLAGKFLKAGGLTTTLIQTGQQWDAPNGWAPLQWIAYKGAKNYRHFEISRNIKSAWLGANMGIYESAAKFVEKYNVEDLGNHAGGGEYELQDGFGWTNGVFLALNAEPDDKN